jgi:hypothetical protein
MGSFQTQKRLIRQDASVQSTPKSFDNSVSDGYGRGTTRVIRVKTKVKIGKK